MKLITMYLNVIELVLFTRRIIMLHMGRPRRGQGLSLWCHSRLMIVYVKLPTHYSFFH